MDLKIQLVLFLCANLFVLAISTNSEAENITYPTLNPDWSYCYEFTWLGPDYNNVTGYNGTCDDWMDETRAGENIPCIPPIVISNNGTVPDISYLWKYYRASVVCSRSQGQACVKYSYLYNGIVTNQTHMCARVRADKGEIASGCYKQEQDGYTIEMCVCKSGFGLTRQPCNSAVGFGASGAVAVMLGLLLNWLGK